MKKSNPKEKVGVTLEHVPGIGYGDLRQKSVTKKYKVEKIKGGLASGMSELDFNPVQLKKGIKVELEHTNDPNIAKEIAMDHLVEDEDYYIKLEKMEKSAGKRWEGFKERVIDFGVDKVFAPYKRWETERTINGVRDRAKKKLLKNPVEKGAPKPKIRKSKFPKRYAGYMAAGVGGLALGAAAITALGSPKKQEQKGPVSNRQPDMNSYEEEKKIFKRKINAYDGMRQSSGGYAQNINININPNEGFEDG